MGYFKLINLEQTNVERQEKYHLARSLGMNSYWAMAMRDWRLSKIERLFGLERATAGPQQPRLFTIKKASGRQLLDEILLLPSATCRRHVV